MSPEQEKVEQEKHRVLKVEQAEIDAGKRVREFLNDDAVKDGLRRIEKRYLAEFRDADTDDKRRNVWASTKALQDLVADLNGTIDGGKFAQHQRTIRDSKEQHPHL